MPGTTAEPPSKRQKNSRKVVRISTPEPPKPPPSEPTEEMLPSPEPPQVATPAAQPEYVAPSLKAFPPPPRPEGKGSMVSAEQAMNYWRSLPPEFIARTESYVYRLWPILDRGKELTESDRALIAARKKATPTQHIDKPATPFGPDTRMEFLRRYGSGMYKVYINDAGVKTKEAKDDPNLQRHTLVKFTISVHDNEYPPVLDPSRPDKGIGILDLSHPENASYIADLRMKGVLPLEAITDMQSDVVKDLAGKVGQLADQVAAGKQEQLFAKLKEEIGKNTGGGDMQTLLLMKMMDTKAAPAADTVTPIINLFQSQMSNLQAELREERAERRRQEELRANQPPPDPFAWFERMTETMSKAKAILTGNNGASGDGIAATAVKHASRMSGTLEFFAEVIPKIVDSPILNALANKIALSTMMPSATNGTAAAGTGTTTAATPAQQADADAKLLKFVQEVVTPAMVEYLESEANGADFAEWIYCGFPNRLRELQQRGPAVIVGTYQASPLWPRLMPRAAQFQRFVAEFCAWKPDEDRETEAPAQQTNGVENPVIEFDEPLEGQPL